MTGKAEKRISAIQGVNGPGEPFAFFSYYYYFPAVRPKAGEV